MKKTLLLLQIAIVTVLGICAHAEASGTEADARKSPVLRAMIESREELIGALVTTSSSALV